jgi:hypothetical protein
MRTWTRFALAALLAAPFTLATARAADPELKETTEQKVQRLERELKQLRADLDDLRERLTTNALRRNSTSRSVTELQERLALLEQMVLRHDDLMRTTVTRQSAYAPGTQPAVPNGAAASTGTITVRNQYLAAATVRINGRAYTVEPGRTATIAGVPVGPFNYEVDVDGYGIVQPLRTETLRPVGHEITIYPRVGG